MKIISNNNIIFYLTFFILFLVIFRFMENKFNLLSISVKLIKSKCNFHNFIIIAIFIVSFIFTCLSNYLNPIACNILMSLSFSFLCSLIALNKKDSSHHNQ